MESPAVQQTLFVREIMMPQRVLSNQIFQAERDPQIYPPHFTKPLRADVPQR